MTIRSIFSALQMFLRILNGAIFVYWILTFLRFNNQLVQVLAKFIYPFAKPFNRLSRWIMRRTGLPIDFTLFLTIFGLSIVSNLLSVIYLRVFIPLGLF